MKKIVLMMCFLLSITAASADEKIPAAPQWREICPSLYMNVDSNGEYMLPEKQYWAHRRKMFEESKHYCSHNYEYDLEKLTECYAVLKSSELRKTKDFETVQKNKAKQGQGVPNLP